MNGPDYFQYPEPKQYEPTTYPGDLKAAKDPADYPKEWTPEQRVSAYWIALRLKRNPQSEAEWKRIVTQNENENKKRHNVQQAIEFDKRRNGHQ